MTVNFDPIAISIFGWGIHWYGLMYVMAFVSAWWLARLQTNRHYKDWNYEQIDDLLFMVALVSFLAVVLAMFCFTRFLIL